MDTPCSAEAAVGVSAQGEEEVRALKLSIFGVVAEVGKPQEEVVEEEVIVVELMREQ